MSELILSVCEGQICCLAYCGTRGQNIVHIVLQSGFSETELGLVPSVLLAILMSSQHLEKSCSEIVYISLLCLFSCWMMCFWDAVPALLAFCFQRFSSQELQGSLKASLLWLWKFSYTAQTWRFILWHCCLPLCIPAVVVRERLHKQRGTSPAKHLRHLCYPGQCPCPSWNNAWKAALERCYWV